MAGFCFAPVVRSAAFLLLLLACLGVRSHAEEVPPIELQRNPSTERINALMETADRLGWGPNVEPLRNAALAVYEHDAMAAPPWFYLYRWAQLLSLTQVKALQDWVMAVNDAKAGHAGMSIPSGPVPGTMGGLLTPEFQRYLLSNPVFSEEFFNLLSPLDQPVQVLHILQTLYAANPAQFAEYGSLAIAIALVYDVPPPLDWPHGQVPATLLPRRFAPPLEAFNYWVRLDRANLTAHQLRRLPASELKFVVDTITPLAELTWAQRNVSPPLAQLDQAYSMIKYRQDRISANNYSWKGADYSMQSILKAGGICVDQAYFAANAGKARGIPTLMFRGAGMDGRHAWFGYLSPSGWVLDAGRYAEQSLVVGIAFDPQTWRPLTDFELLFLSERFRALPLYKLSVIHAEFALEYLQAGKLPDARKSAREAVNRERRNLQAWEVLLSVVRAAQDSPREVEAVLREAVLAFARYPDLEIGFARQLTQSLRGRGETSLAASEEQRLAKKYQNTRADLTLQTAADILQRSMVEDELPTQIRKYNQLLDTYGRGAGTDFFDKVVVPFAFHLRDLREIPSAYAAIKRAKETLRVEKGTQLEHDLAYLREELVKDK